MRNFLRIISIILLVFWMGLIFYFSAQEASASTQTSGQVIEIIAEKFYPDFEQMTIDEQQEVVSSLQFIVRKTAHIAVYAVLGFFAFLVFVSYVNLRFFTRTFWAAIICFVYAASDEYHQRFVVGRSCELRDFLLDCAGVLVAILLCTAFVKIISPLRRSTAFAGVTVKTLKKDNLHLNERLDLARTRNSNLKKQLQQNLTAIEELEIKVAEYEQLLKQKDNSPTNQVNTAEELPEEQALVKQESAIGDTLTEEALTEEALTEEALTEDVSVEEAIIEAQTEEPKAEEPVVEDIAQPLVEALPEEENLTENIQSQEENAPEQLPKFCQPVLEISAPKVEKREVKISQETEYASKVIGACVVEVTRVCNKITSSSNGETQKELVNLALGRCEVLKSEILKILGSKIDFEQKKNLIEKEKQEAFDYFDSIVAQMC